MHMKRFMRHPLIPLFALFILSFSIISVFLPKRSFSELENRYLTRKPAITLKSVWDNSFSEKYEYYLNDHFAGRDSWITLKAFSESSLGKLENNGILRGEDGYLFEKYLSYEEDRYEKNIGYLYSFLEKHSENTSLMLVPSSDVILKEKRHGMLNNVDQQAKIDAIYAASACATIDVGKALEAHREEYIYYRTDHHWTTLGAYYAYEAYCRQKELSPILLGNLSYQTVSNFYGTYFSKAKLQSAHPDTITYYSFPGTELSIDGAEKAGLYNVPQFQKRDKYAGFLYGNNGRTDISSPADNDNSLLVIKDSFANSLIPFLTANYSSITAIDLRYFHGRLQELVQEGNFTDILILFQFKSIAGDTTISRLAG